MFKFSILTILAKGFIEVFAYRIIAIPKFSLVCNHLAMEVYSSVFENILKMVINRVILFFSV